jgi:hypothetical protein
MKMIVHSFLTRQFAVALPLAFDTIYFYVPPGGMSLRETAHLVADRFRRQSDCNRNLKRKTCVHSAEVLPNFECVVFLHLRFKLAITELVKLCRKYAILEFR